MERREFLRKTAAAAATAFVATGWPARSAASQTASGTRTFELEEVTIAELQAGMASGRWTAQTITQTYLERIAQLDRRGPELRAVIETNPDALAIAEQLDRERAAGRVRGPLHGIPILLKDNLDTHDRMTTTAGSLALEGSIPPQDSTVARKLREAGAILLGKANLSEWANFRSEQSTSGWSARGGQCRNPYALDRNPCGSSSGSGVGPAANLCAAAIGTETNGSIVCPSSANGIVGIKPTVGLVSRAGIIPISHTQDTAGPMARTVADAATILGALVGADERDPATAASAGHFHTDYTRFLDAEGLRGARIGVLRQAFGFHRDVDTILEQALGVLRERGAVLVDPVELPRGRDLGRNELTVLLYEFKHGLNAYLASLGPAAPVKSLKEIIDFNEKNKDREMPYFGQDLFLQAEEKGPLTEEEYTRALASILKATREDGIDKVMDEHRLDAIFAPTGGPAWVTDLVNGDHFGGGSSGAPAIAGYPNITVPAGFVFGLPVGVSFFGRAWSEPVLIRIAYAFEQATRVRRPPRMLPHADLTPPAVR
ncbi:MAG: amidase [Acidobacteriia bacterium]|jgi:amidase|nr:amidase [Terriglobia bacterium]